VQTGQESSLQVQYRWDNPEWKRLNNVGMSVTDGEGHRCTSC